MLILKLFLLCLVLHLFADFTLQGILANLKCRSWWKENYPDKRYRHDYITALIIHSVYWVLVTAAPVIMIWNKSVIGLVLTLLGHAVLHAVIDNAKANKLSISLFEDQCYHFIQVIFIVLAAC